VLYGSTTGEDEMILDHLSKQQQVAFLQALGIPCGSRYSASTGPTTAINLQLNPDGLAVWEQSFDRHRAGVPNAETVLTLFVMWLLEGYAHKHGIKKTVGMDSVEDIARVNELSAAFADPIFAKLKPELFLRMVTDCLDAFYLQLESTKS
jgi:hypothetical protein